MRGVPPLERRILGATLIGTEVTDGSKWIGLGATAPLTTGSFCRTLRHRIGLNSARNGAIVSVPTATSTVASNSRMSRSEGPLPQLYDTILERCELCVTGRRRKRERAGGLVEALRARGDVGRFIHRISGGLARGQFS